MQAYLLVARASELPDAALPPSGTAVMPASRGGKEQEREDAAMDAVEAEKLTWQVMGR